MSASQDKKRRQAEREAGTSPKTLAEREACQIEHIITDETFHRMQEYNARHGEEGAAE